MPVIRSAFGELGSIGVRPPFDPAAAPAPRSASVATASATNPCLGRTAGHSMNVAESRVALPAGTPDRLQVYVNGILQRPGRDYRREGSELVFERRLAREGRLGFWRWTSLFLGIAGTYRQNDSVDVVYEAAGRRVVAT